MFKDSIYIKPLNSIIIFALALSLSHPGLSQGLIISPGTSLVGSGGNIVLIGDAVNDGYVINSNNTVIFSGTAQSLSGSSPILFNNLIVASGSMTSILTPGHTLSGILLSNGMLNANGNMTLLSTADQTALIDGSGSGGVFGDVTMQRYLSSGFGYKYFSSPFQAATVAEFGDDMDLTAPFESFYRYDEGRTSSGWVSYINPAWLLDPMRGYAVNFGASADENTVDATGIVNNGSLSLTLYNNNNLYTKGFNLIGNPYPSPIDWNATDGWTKANIDDALYYFESSTADQYGGTYSTYMNGISSDGFAANIIPSMQGFFVHVSDGAWPVTGMLTMNNDVRLNNQAHPFIKSKMNEEKPYLRLVSGFSDDSASYDPLVVYFDENATCNFDGQLDALKLFNTDAKVTNFYSFGEDGRRLSINALPVTVGMLCTIRLGIKTERDGDVIFRIEKLEGDFYYNTIYLSDLITGSRQELHSGKEYKIHLIADHYQNRFFLLLSNNITDIPDLTLIEDWIKIYADNGILKVEIMLPSCKNGTLKVNNILGQALFVYKIDHPGYHEFNPILKTGIYIVTFSSDKRKFSVKIHFESQ
ncbi:MAG: hypothetical protein JXN62_02260 [Bacteroidales bacterium]|nr:hypothetical protein [Bacteroidales bacterium]